MTKEGVILKIHSSPENGNHGLLTWFEAGFIMVEEGARLRNHRKHPIAHQRYLLGSAELLLSSSLAVLDPMAIFPLLEEETEEWMGPSLLPLKGEQ